MRPRPTYEELDYSPPPSPKNGSHRQPPPKTPSFQWYLRRSRTLLIPSLIIIGLIYFFTHHRGPLFKPKHEPSLRYKNVDWSLFAYSQFATDSAYLCNALMIFDALHRLGSKADRILLYPQQWDDRIENKNGRDLWVDRDYQLLVKAQQEYGVKLIPTEDRKLLLEYDEGGDHTWDDSINKFHAFNQTQYERVIHLDSDITLRKHLDELFLLPQNSVAMTRAYWELPEIKALTSLFIMLEPDEREAKRLFDAASPDRRKDNMFDMEIVNAEYGDSAMVLPHRKLVLLSGEFRAKNHEKYLGNAYEKWDPARVLQDSTILHFSDWPLPKPWIMWPRNLLTEMMPTCENNPGTATESGCENRKIWLELYNDFRKRRKVSRIMNSIHWLC